MLAELHGVLYSPHMKTITWALVVLVLVGGGYYAYSKGMLGGKVTQESQEKMTAEPTISWTTADAGEQNNVPFTKVTVTVNGTAHEVGNFAGTCSEIGATGGVDGKGLVAGELSALQCWYAGGGDEIGVFAIEDGGYEVMIGKLDEPTAESQGLRGDFQVRSDIKL